MRPGGAQRAGDINIQVATTLKTWPGMPRIQDPKHIQSAKKRQMSWACLICPAMFGNGAVTGREIIPPHPYPIPGALIPAPTVSTAAGRGTTTRASSVYRAATASRLRTAASTSAFALPGPVKFYHFYLFTLFVVSSTRHLHALAYMVIADGTIYAWIYKHVVYYVFPLLTYMTHICL